MRTDFEKKHFDWFLLITILALLGIGLAMCTSASFIRSSYQSSAETLMRKQALAAGIGLVMMIVLSKIDYRFYKRFAGIALFVATALNVFVAFSGAEENGAKRWFAIGGHNLFQPSELMKVTIILYLSAILSDKEFAKKSKGFEGLVTVIFPFAVGVGSVLLQKHTSATIIILVIGVVIMFFAGVTWRIWVSCIAGGGVLMGVVLMIKPDLFSHVTSRFTTYSHTFLGIINEEGLDEEILTQIQNSLWAIGSGGLTGRGFGNSIQKYSYLPECYNDFIFAIVAEELGFLGVVLIIGLFATLILRGLKVAAKTEDGFGSLMATGIVTMIAIQMILNLSVVSCLIPVTGVSLPFFSYGGTSLVVILAAMGILLNIASQADYSKLK